jgi:hypothetical protein
MEGFTGADARACRIAEGVGLGIVLALAKGEDYAPYARTSCEGLHGDSYSDFIDLGISSAQHAESIAFADAAWRGPGVPGQSDPPVLRRRRISFFRFTLVSKLVKPGSKSSGLFFCAVNAL